MITLILFVLGVLLIVYSILSLGLSMFAAAVQAALFIAPKSNLTKFKYSIGYIFHSISLTIGISLVYLFNIGAKTFVLLNI